MITRTHGNAGTRSGALYSDCETYRYLLYRDWACTGPRLIFILLNPSTATEERNDPTIARCERRARAAGFAGFSVANLFALRATDPCALRHCTDPVGPENDAVLAGIAAGGQMVLCGWGVHGALFGRDGEVTRLLCGRGVKLWHLGLTRAGHPRHPLYIGHSQAPQPWGATRMPKNASNCA